MSVASLLNSNKVFDFSNVTSGHEVSNSSTFTNGSASVTHSIDNSGAYHIKNDATGTNLLSVHSDNSMLDCAVKQHVYDSTAPLNRTVASHTSSINVHDSRLTSLEGLPVTADIVVLQAQVLALTGHMSVQTQYINTLKLYIGALREVVYISNEDGNNEYDYSGLL